MDRRAPSLLRAVAGRRDTRPCGHQGPQLFDPALRASRCVRAERPDRQLLGLVAINAADDRDEFIGTMEREMIVLEFEKIFTVAKMPDLLEVVHEHREW